MVENALRFTTPEDPPVVGDTLVVVMPGGASHEVEVRVEEVIPERRTAYCVALDEPTRHIFVAY